MPAAALKVPRPIGRPRKKPAIVEAVPTAPVIADDRLALFDAIEARKKADDAVTRQHEAVRRAQNVISEAEEHIEKLRGKIEAADLNDERRAASLIKAERPIVSGFVGSSARHAVEHAEANLAMTRRAQAQLQSGLRELELQARLAENAVLVERNKLIAPVAARTVERLESLRLEMAEATALLEVLMRDHAPKFSDRDLIASKKCADAREAALADVRPYVVNGLMNEIFEIQQGVRAEWSRKLAALMTDATSEL
jgi:hypothetical protein